MDVRCEKCDTTYELDDSRVTDAGVNVRCSNCGNLFRVRRRGPVTREMPRLRSGIATKKERSWHGVTLGDLVRSIADVAATMARQGVGCVVIVEHGRLLGIVTDRDLVVRGVARALPLDSRIDAVMSMDVIAIDRDADIRSAIASFGHHAVRRMPVVDGHRVMRR